METVEFWASHLGVIASFIGSLTVVGSALIWVNKKLYLEPRDKRREAQQAEERARMREVTEEHNRPLIDSINRLDASIKSLESSLFESARDRENLNKIVDNHEIRISRNREDIEELSDRVIVLETKSGEVTYIEHYGEGKE